MVNYSTSYLDELAAYRREHPLVEEIVQSEADYVEEVEIFKKAGLISIKEVVELVQTQQNEDKEI